MVLPSSEQPATIEANPDEVNHRRYTYRPDEGKRDHPMTPPLIFERAIEQTDHCLDIEAKKLFSNPRIRRG